MNYLLCYSKVGNTIDSKGALEWIPIKQIVSMVPMEDYIWRREEDALPGKFTFWEVITEDSFCEYAYPIFDRNFSEETFMYYPDAYENEDWFNANEAENEAVHAEAAPVPGVPLAEKAADEDCSTCFEVDGHLFNVL